MDDGEVYQFSIYDWKEYREYEDDEPITWHIGGADKELTDAVAKAINKLLNKNNVYE